MQTVANRDPKSQQTGEMMTDFAAARLAMVDCQVRPSDVTAYPIIDAMLTVRKEDFVPSNKRAVAYAGDHIPLADGRVILDGRTLGKMLDAAAVTPDDLVLNVGCGLGYASALLGHLAATVIAVEPDADMAAQAANAMAEQDILNVIVEEAALTEGAPGHGPYDVIFVEGAVETVPDAIADQLKLGGRIIAILIDGRVGAAHVGVKTGNGINWRRAFDATAPVLPGFEAEKAFEF